IGGETAKVFENAQRNAGVHAEFLLTPDGLAILLSQSGIVLWVPKDDLEKALADAAKADAQTERLDSAGFHGFDRDHKGWLDDSDRRAMRHDPAFQKEHQALLDAVMKKALAQHGAAWDIVFSEADSNHDGKLS